MSIELSITEWTGWAGAAINDASIAKQLVVSESPVVDKIPPMLRRRLNLLGRACASEILSHTTNGDAVPIVYCSRHGDIDRTLSVLQELSAGSPVSPMTFSLAVHNAICGVASIHQQLKGNISTIAADDGLIAVLLEAAGLLNDGHDKVLCLVADTCLPEIYRRHTSDSKPSVPYAACFLVNKTGATKLQITTANAAAEHNHDYPALQLLAFLGSTENELRVSHNNTGWAIVKI